MVPYGGHDDELAVLVKAVEVIPKTLNISFVQRSFYLIQDDKRNGLDTNNGEKQARADKAFSPPLMRLSDWIFLPGG